MPNSDSNMDEQKAYLWIIPLADETLVWESKGKEGELNEYEFADKYMNHKVNRLSIISNL